MATELAVSYVSIVPSLKGFKGIVGRELGSAEKSAKASGDAMGKKMGGSFASSLKRVVGPALAVFGAGQIAGFAKQAVGAFSELEDSTAAAGVVFGKNMQQIIDQSKTAAKDLGLTQQQVISAANTFGTYGKAAGLSGKALADFATEQTALAADMASFKGTSPEQAIEAIGSALRGEMEPIRAYGVLLDDASLRQEALAMGLISTTKDALSPQNKTLAAQSLIIKQTSDAQGDFARTSDSTANVAKTLSSTLTDVSAKLGQTLAPAFTGARLAALGAVQGVAGMLDKVLAFQGALTAGAMTPDLVKALGLDPKQGFGKVVGEGIGSLRAFGSAWKANDGDITSSGLAGYMEGLAFKLRGFLDTASRVGKEVWASLGPALTQLGPPVLALIMALSPLGVVLKALGPVLPDLADAASELAVVVAGVLTVAVETLTPIISAVVSGLAGFFKNLTSTQAGVDGLMGALAIAGGIFLTYKVATIGATVATNIHTAATNAAALAQKGLNLVMKANPIMLVISLIAGLVAGLVWFFTETETGRKIVQNVWAAIQSFVGGVVTWFQTHVLPTVLSVFNAVGAVFTWLHQNIIKPVFAAIGWVVNAWWQVTSALFRLAIGFIRDKLGATFTWLHNNIIKPVFTAIGAAISWWWKNVTMPVFNALVAFVKTVLAPIFTWLYNNIIKPVWDGISRAISTVWNHGVKPVFNAISDAVKKIPAAFEAAKDGITTAWNKIKEAAKTPVKFVVNTVIGGLVDTFNKIPGVNIPKPKLPRGFAKGGFAAPGWAMVGEEGPELVNFSKPGRVYTAKETAHALAGGPQAAVGSHVFGGVPSFRGPAFENIDRANSLTVDGDGASKMRWSLDQAARMWNGLANVRVEPGKAQVGRSPFVYGMETSRLPFAAIPNWAGYYSGGSMYFNPAAGAAMDWRARRTVAAHEIGHALGLPHAMATGARSIMNYNTMYGLGKPTIADANALRSIYGAPGKGMASSQLPDDSPSNPFSGLVDTLMAAFKKAFPGAGLFVDAAGGLAKSGIESVVKIVTDIQNGIKKIAGDIWGNIKSFFGGSGEAAELHDNGGVIRPGYTRILNKTRKPEALLNPQQWSDISKLALEGGGGRSITIQGNVGWMPDEVARQVERAERRQRIVEGVL